MELPIDAVSRKHLSLRDLLYGSVGYPALTHAWNPPCMAATLWKPLSNRICAARALLSSWGQVQYVMIH